MTKLKFKKAGHGYHVLDDGQRIGWVWRTTSGAVWGALSCTPALSVWAYSRDPGMRPAGSSATRQGAASFLRVHSGSGRT